jgi:predicted PhzF superfamily epimerase YddE/YHI9
MAAYLDFVTLDVFTTTHFKGNPLGIVHIPPSFQLSQAQKQTIAREFNLSETVFVHDVEANNDQASDSRHIDIFMTDRELPFAGHPTVGTACYLQAQGVRKLITKAGPISIHHSVEDGVVSAVIPHDIHLNSKVLHDHLHPDPDIRSAELTAPLFSIVKGVTFALIRLPSEQLLSKPFPGAFPCTPKTVIDAEWSETLLGRYYFMIRHTRLLSSGKRTVELSTRMMVENMEDPATGAAACALASYLALTHFEEPDISFKIRQGVEMGRQSDIVVEVQVSVGQDGKKSVKEVRLGGESTQIMKGKIAVPYM